MKDEMKNVDDINQFAPPTALGICVKTTWNFVKIVLNSDEEVIEHNNDLIFCYPFVIPHIVHVINSYIQNRYFLKSSKVANVIAIPKESAPSKFSDLT